MAIAPIHKIDGIMEYVIPTDSAWMTDKLEKEFQDMEANGEDSQNHPYIQYFWGDTRLQLDTVADYLDRSKNPVIFRFRRLKPQAMLKIRDMQRAGQESEAAWLAAQLGIEAIENLGMTLASLKHSKAKTLSDADMEKLAERIGIGDVIEIGSAVILANDPLKKKKP